MGNLEEPIEELGDEYLLLPRPTRPPIVPWALAAGALALAAAVFFGTARPAIEREQRMRKEAAAAALQLDEARRVAAGAKDAAAELEKLRAESAKLRDDLAQQREDQAVDSKLVEQLKTEVGTGKGAEVEGDGGRITVTMVDKILFKSGVAELTPEGEQVLGKIGAVLKTVDGKLIEVCGHADNQHVESAVKEKYPTNWELSTARATNVVRYLEEQGGLRARRLKAAGFGSSRPVASNRSEAGRAKNRRIEILLLPEAKIVKGDFADEIANATPKTPKTPKTAPATTKVVPAKETRLAATTPAPRTKRKK